MINYQRYLQFLVFICTSSIGFAYFLEIFFELEVCPLCMIQRLAIFLILFTAFAALLKHSIKFLKYLYNNIILAFAVFGFGVAARQVWLQSLPPEQVPSCIADLDRILSMYSFLDSVKMILLTSGDCAKIEMKILFFTLPQLTAMLFAFIILLALYVNSLLLNRRI